jgi:hypothetical protein
VDNIYIKEAYGKLVGFYTVEFLCRIQTGNHRRRRSVC